MLGYQLIDFGSGRKLEQFGEMVLDRVCPAASGVPKHLPARWAAATVCVESSASTQLNQPWCIALPLDNSSPLRLQWRFELKITPFGHVGLFPEQLDHWFWLSQQAHIISGYRVPQALNLFGYTGGSTLALASAGAAVVHVDASQPAVTWARENAKLNELELHPIRWIVEDARRFVQREIRRGRRYDIIVLDPPTYGHGPQGRSWSLTNDWQALAEDCLKLLAHDTNCYLLWTGHSQQPDQVDISNYFRRKLVGEVEFGRNRILDLSGRELDAGWFVRILAEKAPHRKPT